MRARAHLLTDNWDDWFKYNTTYTLVGGSPEAAPAPGPHVRATCRPKPSRLRRVRGLRSAALGQARAEVAPAAARDRLAFEERLACYEATNRLHNPRSRRMNAFVVFRFAMWRAGPAFSELGGNWAATSKPLPPLLYLVLSRRNVHRNDDLR